MANKKGKLTKAELYYIQENPNKLSITDLSKELKRSVVVIGKALRDFMQNPSSKTKKKVESGKLAEVKPVEEPVVEPLQTQPVNPENMLQSKFGHDKSGKRGYSIMTPSASEMSDVLTGKGPGNGKDQSSRFNQEHIFKPVKNKKQR